MLVHSAALISGQSHRFAISASYASTMPPCCCWLLLLQEFDKRELVLLAKSSAKGEERDDLQAKLSDLGRQIDAKKAEADSVAAAKAAVVAEFDAQVPEKHPFRDALTHIFNRWVPLPLWVLL